MHHLTYASEQHKDVQFPIPLDLEDLFIKPPYSKQFRFNEKMDCYRIHCSDDKFLIDSNYYIGVDWIIKDRVAIYIEPKLNNGLEIDFLSMLIESLEATENFSHLTNLVDIQYGVNWINIPQKKDLLSPILIIQFLKLVQNIVKKGLKKSYYTVETNLNNRIKGKILVGRQIKENILKRRLTNTVCQYQEFGVNFIENQFLKTVLSFVKAYLYQPNYLFPPNQKKNLISILNYCLPAFHNVDLLPTNQTEVKIRKNAFFKDYEEANKVGTLILKRFSYNISRVSEMSSKTPPFWIDMSKLFELYVFKKLQKAFPNPNAISYHDRFMGGKETDILIRADGYESVIDCKYKPYYKDNNPSLADKRQLAGYTRLKSVYNKLNKPYNEVLKGLIIYSHQQSEDNIKLSDLFETSIDEYVDFYKLGISLPVISSR